MRVNFNYFIGLGLVSLVCFSGCRSNKISHDDRVSCYLENALGIDIESNCAFDECSLNEEMVFSLLQNELTDNSVILIAFLNNPEVQALLEDLGIAKADLLEAGLYQNPFFDAFFRYPDKKSLSLNTEFAIMQSFLDFVLAPLRVKIAEAEFEKTSLLVSNKLLELAFETRETFYSLVAKNQQLVLLQHYFELLEAKLELARAQVTAGNISMLEGLRYESGFLEAKISYSQSLSERACLQEKLKRLFGLKPCQPSFYLPDELPDICDEEQTKECLFEMALTTRLDLKAVSWEIEKILRMGQTKKWWAYTAFSAGFAGEKDTDGIWTRGPAFSGTIPIFNFGQADRARLLSLYSQQLYRYEALKIAIFAQVTRAEQVVVFNREMALAYQNQVLPLYRQVVQDSTSFYHAMAYNIYQLIDDVANEKQAEIKSILSKRDYWIAKVNLSRSLGGDFTFSSGLPCENNLEGEL